MVVTVFGEIERRTRKTESGCLEFDQGKRSDRSTFPFPAGKIAWVVLMSANLNRLTACGSSLPLGSPEFPVAKQMAACSPEHAAV